MFYDKLWSGQKLSKYNIAMSSVTLTFGPRSLNFKILILLIDVYMCTKFSEISSSGSKLIKYLCFGVKSVFFGVLYLSNPLLKLDQTRHCTRLVPMDIESIFRMSVRLLGFHAILATNYYARG